MTPTPEQIEAAARTFSSSSWDTLSPEDQHRFREKAISALTAAAGVGDDRRDEHIKYLEGQLIGKREATIERCAQVADRYTINIGEIGNIIAAEIRALKSESK